jgi:hypothetical protein
MMKRLLTCGSIGKEAVIIANIALHGKMEIAHKITVLDSKKSHNIQLEQFQIFHFFRLCYWWG